MDKSEGMIEMEGKRFLVRVRVEDNDVVVNIPSDVNLRNPIHMVRFESSRTEWSGEIKVYTGDGNIAVSYVEDGWGATAELTDIGDNRMYFNRLYVSPKLRGKGLSHYLLDRAMKAVDEMGKGVLCEINPYGPLNYDQLVSLYKRHGFDHVVDPEYTDVESGKPMYRRPISDRLRNVIEGGGSK